MGRTDEGAKRPVTRRSRLLVVRCTQCARCGVSSHCQHFRTNFKTAIQQTLRNVSVVYQQCLHYHVLQTDI